MSPTNHNVNPEAGSVDFDIASNVSWSINDDANWLSVSPNFGTNGSTVTATYDENPSTVARVANITITSGGVSPITVTVTQSEASATDDIDKKINLKLYPNPTSEHLNLLLSMAEAAELNIEILNLTGQKLDVISSDYLGSGEHLFKYDVHGLANGLYLVRLQSDEGVKTLRFIVNR